MVEESKNILLVEDEAIIALAKKVQLEKLGYRVMTVSDGEKSLAEVENNRDIDLVLMDIDLGSGIDGTEAAEGILKTRNIPIVFLSSHTEPEIVRKTERITSYGYVVKSSDLTVLDASIKMAFKLFDAKMATEFQRRRLETTLNSIGDAVISTDTEGKVTSLNNVAEELTGWPEEDAINRDLNEVFRIINADSRNPVDNPVEKVLATKKIIGLANHTILISRHNGEYQIADSAAPIIDYNGDITGVVLVFRDVSGEYESRKEIEKSEKKYRELFEAMNSGICIHEVIFNENKKPVNYRIIDANLQYEKILGIKTELVKGKLATEVYNTKAAPFLDIYSEVAETEKPYRFESYFEEVNKYFKISVFSPEKGQFVTVFDDITEEKTTARKLAEKNQLFRQLAETISEVFWVCTPDWKRIEYISPGYSAIWGLPAEDLIKDSMAWFENIHPDDRQKVRESLEKKINGDHRNPELPEYRLIMPDGKIRWILAKAYPVYDDSGKVVSITGIATDISYFKRTERVLRENEEKFRLFYENSGASIATYGPDGTILSVNNKAAEIMHLKPRELEGKSIFEFFPEKEAEEYLARIKSAYKSGEPEIYENEILFPAGSRYFLSTYKRIGDSLNGITGIQVISQDITDRKAAENRISALLAEKELVLREVTHRIKNNLNTIHSLLELQAGSAGNQSAAEALEDAARRVDGIRTIYSKISDTDSVDTLSVREYLTELTEKILSAFPHGESIDLQLEIEDAFMEAQKIQILGIIVNELITNSMKHAFPAGGAGKIAIRFSSENSTGNLRINDNGKGLPEGFDFQKNRGLGILLIDMLINQLKGSFRISGNNGTEINLEFPMNQ